MYFFLSLLILAPILLSICDSIGTHGNNCNVVPKDQFIEVGSDIDLECWTSCVRGKIYWTLNNKPVHESLSKTINSSLTVLSLRSLPLQTATVQCHSANTHQVVGGAKIRTYSKPRLISCTLHNEDQSRELLPDSLNCSWEHHIDPSLEINYSVLHSSKLYPVQKEICKSTAKTCTAREIDKSDRPIYPSDGSNMNISIRAVRNDAWKVDSDPKEFDPKHIWKIIPPKIRNVNASSDHLLVKWDRARHVEECHCEVKFSTTLNESATEILNKTLGPRTQGELTYYKFESCSNYTVSVRCALTEAPWSDWSKEETVLSKLKKDERLHLWRKVSEPEKNGVRKVLVLWKEIPSTCQDTFNYTIKQTPLNKQATGKNYTLCDGSTCYVNQDAHRINLAVHSDALSVEESVYVPAVGESLPQITDMQTSTREGVILVSWKAPIQPVSGYMIDWTHDGHQYDWMESKYTTAALSGLLDKKPYNITVTPLFGNKTGHSTRALQVCSRFGDPGNVTTSHVSYDKSALVSWSVSQEACSGVVVNFTIFYNMEEEQKLSLNETVAGTEHSISLKDLKPYTKYSFHVEATALTGTSRSILTLFQTERFGPGFITAVSVCGSIIILLVLTLGLCCAVRWKKFKEKPVPNPGLSSVALWPPSSHQEGASPIPSFIPSESPCDRIYSEETLRTSTSPTATVYNTDPGSEQMEEYVDQDMTPVRGKQDRDPVGSEETQHLSSPDDSTALLPPESGPSSPYRSQTSVETPASRAGKPYKRVPVKQPDKITPVTVYVTLDMFEQGR
ncbi:interleukin-31 receptor subunit alpha-like [Centropristis striata]|uniref:interleukin-31 receptor subunit alpha-like n=1 Tax=Centropristis striata TaxID=184440 RepID=UPI0027E11BB9|nr:interleukin-31 receptor subunit alpha-like [Centropristis striata]